MPWSDPSATSCPRSSPSPAQDPPERCPCPLRTWSEPLGQASGSLQPRFLLAVTAPEASGKLGFPSLARITGSSQTPGESASSNTQIPKCKRELLKEGPGEGPGVKTPSALSQGPQLCALRQAPSLSELPFLCLKWGTDDSHLMRGDDD